MKRNTRFLRIILIILITLLLGVTVIALALANNEPHYKLKENIRLEFRREWIWDENKLEYNDLGDLKRDPDTGLFLEPSPFPEELEGYAHWDPYLGLYIADSIKIDHKNGTIQEDELIIDTSGRIEWPDYDRNENDKYNNAYKKYRDFTLEKYYNWGLSSAAYPDMYIFEKEGLTPEWFELTINDLPMVISKLEDGAPPAYTMSLIMLLTKTDVGYIPSMGASERLGDWLQAFNTLRTETHDKVQQGDVEGHGYLALPYIYENLKNGTGDMLLPILPELANGLDGCDKSITSGWNVTEWLEWFEDNTETLNVLKWVNDKQISMPWLE